MAKTNELKRYAIQIEHGMSIDWESVKANDINSLRKKLISMYRPKRGWDETTIVIHSERLGQYNNPIIGRYIGTFYIYGEPKKMVYHWAVNKKNNWGNHRHFMPTAEWRVNPTTGSLIKN